MLAPFAKKPLNLTLRGITSDDRDLSVSICHISSGHLLTLIIGRPDAHSNPPSSAAIWHFGGT